MNKINGLILNNWGGIKVRAEVEEPEDKIIAAVLYNDHGDDMLTIKTMDGTYQYGWFVNRQGYPDYDQLDYSYYENTFLRKPKLDGEYDCNSRVSNKVFFAVSDSMYFPGEYSNVSEPINEKAAQRQFDMMLMRVAALYKSNYIYHGSYHYTPIYRFLEKYGILTEENLKKYELLKQYFRIEAIDGSAGKIAKKSDWVYGDRISWIYTNGKYITSRFNKHKIKVKSTGEDNWGVSGFELNMGQF